MLAAAAALGLGACPGGIEQPARFFIDAGDRAACAEAVEPLILSGRCATAGCHERRDPAGELDLVSPGLAARLLGVTARCVDRMLADADRPERSFLLEKVSGDVGCGEPMPPIGQPLSGPEVECVRAWLEQLPHRPAAPDAGVDGDAGSADADAGTATPVDGGGA